jgi:hypothetical protein
VGGVSGQLALAAVLTAPEAQALTDEVKRDAETLWMKLRRLYEGGAHVALGYSSWHAYCGAEFGIGRSSSYRALDAGRVIEVVPQLGNEAQARELAPLLRDEGEDAVVDVVRELRDEHGERLTSDLIRTAVGDRLAGRRSIGSRQSSGSVEWYTPERYVEATRAVLGGIDLDPASCALANRIVGAAAFYDGDTDGLAHEWHGRIFLNPPYGTTCGAFVAKALADYRAGRIEAAILLLNGCSYDAQWFRPLWDYLLCFTYGRIPFYSPTGVSNGGATGSVFVYLGPDEDRFDAVFSRFGAVVDRRGRAA